VPMDQKIDWQQGGSRLINTTGHSTSLTIPSMQLNGTGRPVLVHRISVRDEEAVGSNPATPTLKMPDQSVYFETAFSAYFETAFSAYFETAFSA
jgi:hypothetical protein